VKSSCSLKDACGIFSSSVSLTCNLMVVYSMVIKHLISKQICKKFLHQEMKGDLIAESPHLIRKKEHYKTKIFRKILKLRFFVATEATQILQLHCYDICKLYLLCPHYMRYEEVMVRKIKLSRSLSSFVLNNTICLGKLQLYLV
jgi:hypothetical protein